MIRIFLVDAQSAVRGNLRRQLASQPELLVVGEAARGEELIAQLTGTTVDVVVIDLALGDMTGVEVVRYLQLTHPTVRVLVLTMADQAKQVMELFEAGVLGYVLKSAELCEIVHGIKLTAMGKHFVCSELAMRALQQWSEQDDTASALANRTLTERESEVLQLLVKGLSNQEMAEQLSISRRTVEAHRQNLILKTQTRNTVALVHYAMQQGLV